MQLRVLPAVLLFLGSYFPLSLILILQDVGKDSWELPICRSLRFYSDCFLPHLGNPTRYLTLFAITLVSLLFFLWLLRHLKGQHDITIDEAKTIPNDLINYVFPYVVSFMGLDLGSDGKFYGFLLFLLWMFLITYRSGQILMNPLLLVIGWQLYEVQGSIGGHRRNLR